MAAALTLLWASAMPSLAQSQPSDRIAGVFESLEALQDENLGIARRMADLQRTAAADLEAAIDDGTIRLAAHQAIARTFIANSLTLAAAMLTPVHARPGTGGESIRALLQRNVALLQQVAPAATQDRAFAAALTRYSLVQFQVEDLATALERGWDRYGGILAGAVSDGIVSSNAFDIASQTWGIDIPVVKPTGIAVLPDLPAQPPVAVEVPAVPAAEAAPEVPESEPIQSAALPEAIEPGAGSSPVGLSGGITPLVPAAMFPETEVAETQVAEVPTAPVPAVTIPVVAPPVVTPALFGDWRLAAGETGAARATSPNLNGDSRDVFEALSITCSPDGTIRYDIAAARTFPRYRVYSDASQNDIVAAVENVISGDDAGRMTETLTLAHQWATSVRDGGRRLTLRTADGEGLLALFSASGFQEAYAAVEADCAARAAGGPAAGPLPSAETLVDRLPPVPALSELPPVAASTEPAPAPAPAPAPEPEPAAPEPPPATPAAPVAPTPAPRINRPVDIMNFG